MCETHGSVATVWYQAHTRTSEEMSGIITYHVSYRTRYLSKGRRMLREPIKRRDPHSETKTDFMELTESFSYCTLRSTEHFIEGSGASWLWQLNFVR